MPKDEIRNRMREKRAEVKPDERKELGRSICKKVTEPPINLLLRAWRICIYLSTNNEVPTRYIARTMWEAGRDVCVPAYSRTERAYRLYAIDPRTHFIKGHHGIREPAVRVPVMPWDVDAFILPGLAFDTLGGRLGHGAGYYDSILGKATRVATKIALCYDWQVLDTPVPQEPHDISVDWIVTDTRVINCTENRKVAGSELQVTGSELQVGRK